MVYCVYVELLLGFLFMKEVIVIVCYEGNLKIWDRLGYGDNLFNYILEVFVIVVFKDRLLMLGKGGIFYFR